MKQHCNNRQKYRLHSEQNQTLLSDTITSVCKETVKMKSDEC